MVTVMIGPLLLIAAMTPPQAQPVAPAFQPVSGATARATVSVRIVSGVRFGLGHSAEAPGAIRRKTRMADSDGSVHRAELLEFQ